MISTFQTCLACASIVVLSWAITPSWGMYTPTAVIGATLALLFALLACFLPSRPGQRPNIRWPLAIAAMLLSGTSVFFSHVIQHPEHHSEFAEALPWISMLGFTIVASFFIHFWRPGARLLIVQTALLFLTGAALRIVAVLASPNPHIDVFTALRDAPSYLFDGQNPYTAAYEHPYESPPLAYDRYPFYPPLPILVGTPFRALGLDVRLVNVFCDLIAAWVLIRVGSVRGNAVVGALAAGAYLHFPRAAFVISEAWYEPMLAALLGGGLYLIERGKRIGFLLLGTAFTGKQYGPVLLGPMLKASLGQWRWLLAGIAVATTAIVLPFVVWNPRAFFEVVLLAHLQRPSRADAVTIPNLLSAECGFSMPRIVWWILAVGMVVLLSVRAPRLPVQSAMWAGTALLAFVLFHTQSFFNYFYLCEYLMLLGIVASSSQRSQAP